MGLPLVLCACTFWDCQHLRAYRWRGALTESMGERAGPLLLGFLYYYYCQHVCVGEEIVFVLPVTT